MIRLKGVSTNHVSLDASIAKYWAHGIARESDDGVDGHSDFLGFLGFAVGIGTRAGSRWV